MFNKTARLSPEEKGEKSGERSQSVVRSRSTILAIDDDAAFLHILRPVLQEEGFKVLTSTSGAKGLDMLRYAQRDIGVVVLDYSMPQLNGEETLQYVRRLCPHIKVLAVTGVDTRLLPQSFREGVDRFLRKPFRNEELVGAINSLLGTGPAPAVSA